MNEETTLAPYENQLLGDLLAFQAGHVPEAGAPHRRFGTRRRLLVALAIGAVVGAAVVGAVIGTRGGGSAAAQKSDSLTQHIQRALLAANSGFVLHASEYIGGVLRAENWDDPARVRAAGVGYDASGKVWLRNGFAYTGDSIRLETVNLTTGDWMTLLQKFPPGIRPQNFTGPGGGQYLPDSIRMQLASGRLVVVGRESLDGQDTIHLKQQLPPGAPSEFVPSDLWVNASTDLPIREISHNPLSGSDTIVHFQWLPDTPANVAKTVFKAPTGLAHRVIDEPVGGRQSRPGATPPAGSSSSYTVTLKSG